VGNGHSKREEWMEERRRAPRLKKENEVIISVISEEKNIPKKKFLYNYSKDISVSGAKIQSNILLPVGTLLQIDFKLKTLEKQITALGKVKWLKVLIEDKSYEVGVEFVDIPSDAIKTLNFYISQMTKLHRTDLADISNAAKQGDADAQNNLGLMYIKGNGVPQDYAEAAKWFRKAAEQGFARAQYNLGIIYQTGNGVPQDYAEAIKWYLNAAEQGYADAQNNLGLMYQNGEGVMQDYAKTIKWWLKAAEQGHAYAQYNLGLIYSSGLQDYAEAARWLLKSAEQGIADAQFNFGLILEEGRGVQQDSDSAAMWYSEAAEQGHADAQLRLDKLKYK
jgi:FOG: TPR repeat, SEL1 subfamily